MELEDTDGLSAPISLYIDSGMLVDLHALRRKSVFIVCLLECFIAYKPYRVGESECCNEKHKSWSRRNDFDGRSRTRLTGGAMQIRRWVI